MVTTRSGVTAGAVVLLAGSLMGSAAAGAATAPEPVTVAKKLVSPLSMVVAGDGTAYVSQNFAGLLTAVPPGGRPKVVFAAPRKTEVGAVSESRGTVHFATTKGKKALLWSMRPGGRPMKQADLGAYEQKKNPDADQAYGFTDLDATCLAEIPKEVPGAYTGIVESHPYGSAVHRGTTYVADAAGNTILAVNGKGKVSTVAVLAPVPVVVTAEIAAANKLPACSVGHAYNFEAVPTDVEVGKGGWLYVSMLPGGPEDGSAGANGMVVKVKARTGKVRTVASGFAGATGVALADNGDVYVAQLFGGQVSRIKAGSDQAKPYAMVTMPAAVEWAGGHLLVSADVLSQKPKGEVLQY
ncbi:ScyD/ScyE family protein [Nocardioides hwasunensis]|uniref:ScyD/ScyE family protein n=1 Tax=Nocardioides hwasunensis TaxID=397258 RepID=A0ABR8MCT8_9ACTN|nr:ScyD/ScyE family protein [Nocardioides hwasunensis]MBD3913946.1 ScyD/ScyE family protein [Nocardioides hwasunensis]